MNASDDIDFFRVPFYCAGALRGTLLGALFRTLHGRFLGALLGAIRGPLLGSLRGALLGPLRLVHRGEVAAGHMRSAIREIFEGASCF